MAEARDKSRLPRVFAQTRGANLENPAEARPIRPNQNRLGLGTGGV
jgi:hypothetical protein